MSMDLLTVSSNVVLGTIVGAAHRAGIISALAFEEGLNVKEWAASANLSPVHLTRMLQFLSANQYAEYDSKTERWKLGKMLEPVHVDGDFGYLNWVAHMTSSDCLTSLAGVASYFEQSPYEEHHGASFWEVAGRSEVRRSVFNSAMNSTTEMVVDQIAGDILELSPDSLCDIGGCSFILADAVRRLSPSTKVSVVDRFDGISDHDLPVGALRADLFTDVLPKSDIYVLKDVLHDWNDCSAELALANIARSAPVGSKIVITEIMVGDTALDPIVRGGDMYLMAMTDGGRKRTPLDYEKIGHSVGLRFKSLTPGLYSTLTLEA